MTVWKRVACLALLAVLLCPCFALAEESAQIEEVGESVMYDVYTCRSFRGEGISFYEWSRIDGPSCAPLLVLQRGSYTDKGGISSGARLLADLGYVVVTPDLAGHGDCVTDEPLTAFDMISRSAQNIEQIVKFYAGKDYVDSENFGVSGMSLGAMTAFYFAANSELRPRCVLSFSGTPDFSSLLEVAAMYNVLTNGTNTLTSTRKEMILIGYPLIVNSPDLKMDELLSAPVLMVNGGADAFVPVAAVQAFAERAEEAHPGQLTLIIDEEAEHVLPIEDWSLPEVKEFLEKNLPIEE